MSYRNIRMISIIHGIIIALSVLSIFTSSWVNVYGIQSSINPMSSDLSKELKSKIDNLMSKALNDTDNILNSSFITNESNQTSSNIIISKSKVTSTLNSNDSGSSSSSSIIKDQVNTINGVCNSIKVGGNGNDTLASTGNCNDELTGGAGADKFMCGEGNDTVKDFNTEEGDIILDKQNCETIL